MLYSPLLLGSLYHERAIRDKRKIEIAEDGSVCSKPLARTISTSMLNLVNIVRAIIGQGTRLRCLLTTEAFALYRNKLRQ